MIGSAGICEGGFFLWLSECTDEGDLNKAKAMVWVWGKREIQTAESREFGCDNTFWRVWTRQFIFVLRINSNSLHCR